MKRLMVFTVFGLIATFLLCGCTGPKPSSAANSFPDVNSEIQSQSTASMVPGSESGTPSEITTEEADLTEYYRLAAQYVNQPFAGTKDIQKLDLLYFFAQVAEDYQQKQGATYLVEGDSYCVFPESDLQELSNRLFGFSYDFSIYHDNKYFDEGSRPLNHYNQDTNSFIIEFATSFDTLVSPQVSEITQNGDQILISGDIVFLESLGVLEKTEPRTFTFTPAAYGDLVYYRLDKIV